MAGGILGRARFNRGRLIADYWLVRKKRLRLGDLYRQEGVYTYNGGWNWRAIIATLIGCALAWIGLVVPALRPMFDYGWFIGFGAAAVTHLLLMKSAPPPETLDNNHR